MAYVIGYARRENGLDENVEPAADRLNTKGGET